MESAVWVVLVALIVVAALVALVAWREGWFPAAWLPREPVVVEADPPVVVGPSEIIVVGPSDGVRSGRQAAGPIAASAVVVEPSPDIVVRPSEIVVQAVARGAWDELGWTRSALKGKTIYSGFYRARRGGRPRVFAGRIVQERNVFVPYIADPPPEIKRHSKGPCFRIVKAPWFRVEWHRPARTVDDAILYVEKVLDEALNGKR